MALVSGGTSKVYVGQKRKMTFFRKSSWEAHLLAQLSETRLDYVEQRQQDRNHNVNTYYNSNKTNFQQTRQSKTNQNIVGRYAHTTHTGICKAGPAAGEQTHTNTLTHAATPQ